MTTVEALNRDRSLGRGAVRALGRCLTVLTVALATCVVAGASRDVWAQAKPKGFDKSKAAEGMAQQATEAYTRGEYERAAELYANAFRTDALPNYLYGQARAEQVAGKNDAATEHFKQFMTLPDAEPDRVAKAKDMLAEIDKKAQDARVAEGEQAARSGDFRLAAQIWVDVVKRAPNRVELLYRAGVAYYQAADHQNALAQFDAYLRSAPANATDRNQAQMRRDALAEKLGQAKNPKVAGDTKTDAKAPDGAGKDPKAEASGGTVDAKPRAEAKATWPGWAVTGTGVALLGAGVGVYLSTRGDSSALAADTAKSGGNLVSKISFEEADRRAAAIRSTQTIGLVMAGAGVAATGVGVWLLLSQTDSKVAVAPGPGLWGTSVAVRF